jgi:hypothetical protein
MLYGSLQEQTHLLCFSDSVDSADKRFLFPDLPVQRALEKSTGAGFMALKGKMFAFCYIV